MRRQSLSRTSTRQRLAGPEYLPTQRAKALAVLADAPQPGLVVDLSRVDFLGSTALAALIAIHRELNQHGGWLRIVTGGGRRVRRPFEATSLDVVLPLYNTMSDALANEG